jgi:hypothetical protein
MARTHVETEGPEAGQRLKSPLATGSPICAPHFLQSGGESARERALGPDYHSSDTIRREEPWRRSPSASRTPREDNENGDSSARRPPRPHGISNLVSGVRNRIAEVAS